MAVSSYTFSIANGAAASQEISLGSAVLVGLTFDGWRAGTGAYLKSRPTSDGTKSALYRVNGDYMLQGVTPVANMFVSLPEDEMRGQHWVTLYSGAPGADVNQDGDRTVTISVVYINPRRTSVPQNLSITSLSTTGEIHSDALITCDEDLDVDGDADIEGTLDVTGDTTLADLECEDLNITGVLTVGSGEPTFENMTIEDTLTVGQGVACNGSIEAHRIVCTHIDAPDAPDETHHQYQRGDLTTPAVSTKATGSITCLDAATYETGTVQCADKEVRATALITLDEREILATGDLDVGVDAAVQAVGDITLVAAAAYGAGDITPVAKALYVTGLSKTVITCIPKADFDVDESPKEGVTVTYDGDSYEFNFDVVGDGAPTGFRVDISGATTDAEVATILQAEMDAHLPAALAVSRDGAAVTVTGSVPGTSNDITTAETVVDADFTAVDTAGTVRDYFTINDGATALIYEFDPIGDALQSGNSADYILDISGCTDAQSVAAVMDASITANSAATAVWNSTKLNITLTTVGEQAAAAITENVSNAGFLFTDFTGDADGILIGDTVQINLNTYTFANPVLLPGDVGLAYGDGANDLASALLAEILEQDTAFADDSSAADLVALKHVPGGVYEDGWTLGGSAAMLGLVTNDFDFGVAGIMDGETVTIKGTDYEFDADSDATGNPVTIVIDTAVGGTSTAKADIATALAAAMALSDATIVVTDNLDGTLDFVGAIGSGSGPNGEITDTVADAAFVHTGLGVGTDGSTIGVDGIAMGDGTTAGDLITYDTSSALDGGTIFEFTNGTGAVEGDVEVDISAAATAILIGAALAAAMNTALTGSPATDGEDGTVSLKIDNSFTDYFGAAGNDVANSVVAANSTVLAATGFSGGLDGIVYGDYVTIHGTGYEFTDGDGAGGGRTEVDIQVLSSGADIASALEALVDDDAGLVVSVDGDTVSVQHATVAGPTDVDITKSEEIADSITVTNTAGVAGLLDGETITISDGTPTVDVYEFDDNGSVTPGNISVTIGDGTAGGELLAAAIATALGAAVEASGTAEIDAAVVETAVNLTNRNTDLTSGGAAGNVAITDTVAAAITIAGMASGADGLIQGDYFTINDGTDAYAFSFDPEGTEEDETPAGTYYITSAYAALAGTVKADIISKINGTAILVTASSGGAAKASLVSDVLDEDASLTENVSSASFTINDIAVGATSYSYKVVAYFDDDTNTNPSAAVAITTGPAALSAAECVELEWDAVEDAVKYEVYRTVGGATQGKIGTVNAPTVAFTDTGLTASGSIPTANDTGILEIGTTFRLLGYTTRAAVPDTTELPLAGDACIHYDSDGDKYYLAFNIGSETIVKVEMT